MSFSILISHSALLRRWREREQVSEHLAANQGQPLTNGYVISIKWFHLLLYRELKQSSCLILGNFGGNTFWFSFWNLSICFEEFVLVWMDRHNCLKKIWRTRYADFFYAFKNFCEIQSSLDPARLYSAADLIHLDFCKVSLYVNDFRQNVTGWVNWTFPVKLWLDLQCLCN